MAGTTFTWTATNSSNWTVGTNWLPSGPPTSADTAIVPSGSIQVNSGTVTITDLAQGGSLGGPTSGQSTILATSGGAILVSDAMAVWSGSTLGVDSASFVDIGTSGSAAAGSILIENGHSLLGDGVIVGTLVNNGAIDATNSGALVSSTGGELTLQGAVTGTGTMNIEPGATLQVTGSIAAGETINFVPGGAPETLILGQPAGTIGAVINGFADGDKIEFANLTAILTPFVTNGDTVTVNVQNSGSIDASYVFTNLNFAASTPPAFIDSFDPDTNEYFFSPTRYYVWTGAVSADVGTASNWNDLTDAQTPALLPPTSTTFAEFTSPVGGTLSGTVSAAVLDFFNNGNWTLAPGADLQAQTFFDVGASGTTTALTIGNGSTGTSNGQINVGFRAGANGTLTVSGGGMLQDTAPSNPTDYEMYVGTAGASGTLAASTGTVFVTGAGSLLNLGLNGAEIGNSGGSGDIVVSQGATFIAGTSNSNLNDSLSIGRTGNGTLVVTDPGSEVQAIGVAYVSHSDTGTLVVENSGTFLASADSVGLAGLLIGDGSTNGFGGTGTATVATGGLLASQGYVIVGYSGTQGQLGVSNNGTVEVGTSLVVGDNGFINGTLLAGNGTLSIGAGGTVELTGAASSTNYGVVVGSANSGANSNTIGTGSLTLSGAGALLNTNGNPMAVGSSIKGNVSIGSGATVEIGSPNSALIPALAIGLHSNGTVNVNGGSLLANGLVEMAVSAGSSGTLIVSGAGSTLSATGGLIVGNGGTLAVLDVQNLGAVTTTNLSLGGSASAPVSGRGTVAVTAGGQIEATTAIAVWAGSTLSVDGASSIDIGTSGSMVAGSILVENGNSLIGAGRVSASVVNNGLIEAVGASGLGISQASPLEITGAITGTGSLQLGLNGILQLDVAPPSNQAISVGSGGELILAAPGASFANAITGLNTGDKIEFGNGMTVTSASVVNGHTIAVNFHGSGGLPGTYDLTNVSFVAGAGNQLFTGTDFTSGDSYIQVAAPFFNWVGGISTDYGTAGNWAGDAVPNATDGVTFDTNPGTITGTGSAINLNFGNFGSTINQTWTLSGANITVAGQPNPPFLPYSIGFYANVVLNGGTLNAAGGSTNISNLNGPTVTAQAGASVTTMGDILGEASGQSGSLVLNGPGVTWTEQAVFPGINGDIGGFLSLGQAAAGGALAGSAGYLTVENSASLNTGGGASVGISQGAFGSASVTSGGNWTVGSAGLGSGLSVGVNGTGALAVNGGTVGVLGFTGIGANTGGFGSVAVTGGGQLSIEGLNVGGSGSGTLTVNGGTVTSHGTLSGTVVSGGGIGIGQNAGGDGTVSVTGSGVLTGNGLTVGSTGDGSLSVNNGVVSDSATLGIGTGSGGYGTVSVTNGTLSFASGMNVGISGDGILTVNSGGTVLSTSSTSSDWVGNLAGSNGLLDVEAGGTFAVTMAPQASIQAIGIGLNAASSTLPAASGSAIVSGAGALLTTNNNPMSVGNAGLGSLLVTAGGSVAVGTSDSSLDYALGIANNGGTGSVTVNGSGSTLTADGYLLDGRGGSGSLLIENNGKVIVNDSAANGSGIGIGAGRGAGPGSTLSVGGNGVAVVTSGGLLDLNSTASSMNVGGNGVNGALTVSNGGMVLPGTAIAIGNATSASGTVYGGTGELDINAGGTVFVNNPVAANGYDVYIGTANSSIGTSTTGTPTGAASGQVVVSGAGAVLNANSLGIAVGWLSDGSLMISQGGTVLSGSENESMGNALSIGRRSTGSVTITDPGSNLTASGIAYVARSGTGSLTVENGASLASIADPNGVAGIDIGGVGNGISVSNGVTYTATGGSGSALVTGGGQMVSAQAIEVGTGGVQGSLTVGQGGTAVAGTQLLIGTSTTVAAGDTIILPTSSIISNGTVLGSSGIVNVEAGGLLQVDGNSPGAPSLVIGSDAGSDGALDVVGTGAVVSDKGALVVGEFGTGNLLIQGGTVTVTALDAGVQTGSAGIVTLTGPNSDLSTVGSLSVGDAGPGELSILNGANVTIGGDLDIGQIAGGSGNVDIEDITGTVFIGGNLNMGAGGPAELTVGPNASVALDNGVINATANATLNLFNSIDPAAQTGGNINVKSTQTQNFPAYVNGVAFALVAGVTYTLNTPQIQGSSSFSIGSGNDKLVLNADTVSGQTSVTFADNTGTLVIGIDQLATIDVPPSGASFTSEANPNLGLPAIGGFSGVVGGFQAGDTIIVDTATAATFSQDGSVVSVIASGTTLGVVNFASTAMATTAMAGGLVDQAPCFAAGTRIATERGEVPVEDLMVGDRVQLVGGSARPMVWLGKRTVRCAGHPSPRKVWPVRVSAGAFGPGRPYRDLWLTPDHAVFVDDVLIPVKHLINGSTIVQVPVDEITYYHVELPQHAVILAEGLAAESYLDTGDRTNFANGGGSVRLHPDFSTRAWEAEGCAPLVVTGPKLAAARRWVNGLAGRAILAA